MKCTTCNNKCTKLNAGLINDIPYWYCTRCKKEVSEVEGPVHSIEKEISLQEEFEEMINELWN